MIMIMIISMNTHTRTFMVDIVMVDTAKVDKTMDMVTVMTTVKKASPSPSVVSPNVSKSPKTNSTNHTITNMENGSSASMT